MAKMTLPTQEQKDRDVAKAERHRDALKKRYDAAKAVLDEVKPDLDEAEAYLAYVQKMPVRGQAAAQPAEQPAEQAGDQDNQPTLFQTEGEHAFV